MKKIGDYLEIHNLTAETAWQDEKETRGIIRGKLQTATPVKVLYMASLELDGMEMIESFRLPVEPGGGVCDLPDIVVVNPIRSDDEKIGNYTLTLKIYSSGGVVDEFSARVRF